MDAKGEKADLGDNDVPFGYIKPGFGADIIATSGDVEKDFVDAIDAKKIAFVMKAGTVYKQEGMKEFKAMWESVDEKVTETVFRMEQSEAFEETIWMIGAATHEAAPRLKSQAEAAMAQQQAAQGSTGQDVKVTDPIRNKGQKVGRNEPCPCGSGKKYKNCHMKA